MRLCTFAIAVALWGCASANPQEDAFLNMTQLVTKYGYPVEKHVVQTEDGYLLSLYRIPYGRACGPSQTPKTPVLLQHGLLCSSFDYVIMGPKAGLGYLMADDCYDVWLGNNRGNSESKAHVSLKTKQKEFWAFSWHEMGLFDLPAMIDHILNVTGQPALHYVGHSQGTTQFFAFASLRPEYHHKIRTMHALSPVAFMKHLTSPMIKMLSTFTKTLQALAERTGLYELFPSQTLLNVLGSEVCKNNYPDLQGVCCNVIFLLCGFDEPQLNRTMLPAVIGHTPAGTGIGPVIHYAQGIKSDQFRLFDYGEKQNLKLYRRKTPPDYPVSQINIPIAVYYGSNDFFAALKDVRRMVSKLPNVIENYLVPYPKFNHLDFLIARDVKLLLYDRVLQVLNRYR